MTTNSKSRKKLAESFYSEYAASTFWFCYSLFGGIVSVVALLSGIYLVSGFCIVTTFISIFKAIDYMTPQ